MQDMREREQLPERWKSDGTFWRNVPFRWCRWQPRHEEWTHDHCNFCFACICNHRDKFPDIDAGERGCYRHAYYAEQEDRTYLWVCRNCFKRVRSEFGWETVDSRHG